MPPRGKLLGSLAKAYHVEAICNKTTEEKIRWIFKMMPAAHLHGPSISWESLYSSGSRDAT